MSEILKRITRVILVKESDDPIQWESYSERSQADESPTDNIGYERASEYQETEFGPLPVVDDSSVRAYRLNRREGYSPTEGLKPHIGEALASSLSISEVQKKEVIDTMSELDLTAFGSQRQLETVALGVISVIVNYDRFQRRQNPDANRISETSEFRNLMIENEIDYSDLGTAKRVTKQELIELGYFD
jgi:hypothetical protein